MTGEGFWRKPAGVGGVGLTHTYMGKSAAGASQFVPTGNRWYLKKIVLASDGLIASVGAHWRWSGGQVGAFHTAVFADNGSGAPSTLLAFTDYTPGANSLDGSEMPAGRWLHKPIGLWCPAGSYWIAAGAGADPGSGLLGYEIGVGSDRWFSSTGGWIKDVVAGGTLTADSYDIRASVIT